MTAPDARRGAALAITAALFAAGFLIAFQAAARGAPRDAVVLAMLAWSAVLNGAWAGYRRAGLTINRVWVVTVLALAGMTIAGNIGVAGALGRLDAGLTSTVLQTQVFFVGLGGRLLLGETITWRFVVGATLAVGGFGLLGLPDADAADVDLGGVLYALLASLAFAAMLVWTRGVITRIEPVSVNAARLLLAVLLLALLPGSTSRVLALPPRIWLLTLAAAACGPFVSRLCLMYAVRHISASRTKLLSLLSPIFAFLLAFVIYRTVPLPRELAGGALILAGVVLPNLRPRGVAGNRYSDRASGPRGVAGNRYSDRASGGPDSVDPGRET